MYKLNRKISNTTAYVVVDKKHYIITGPIAKIAARWLEDQLKEIDNLFPTQNTENLKKIAIDYCAINFNVSILDR